MGSKISTLVFQPPEVTYLQVKKHLIWLQSTDNTSIPAFYIDRKSKVTVLFSHGNAEDLGMIYEWFTEFSFELRVNVLAYDYEGYGKAGGQPSEQSCYQNIDAAYSFLINTLHVPPEQIVLYGRSLGTGPSCYLAERLKKEQALMCTLPTIPTLWDMVPVQAPMLSIFRVAFNFRCTLPYDMFPNIDRIGNIACPVLVIHGVKDEVVPFWNGEQLFLCAPVSLRAKPLWVPDGGHNDLEDVLRKDRVFFTRISDFLSESVPLYNYASTAISVSGTVQHSAAASVPTVAATVGSPQAPRMTSSSIGSNHSTGSGNTPHAIYNHKTYQSPQSKSADVGGYSEGVGGRTLGGSTEKVGGKGRYGSIS